MSHTDNANHYVYIGGVYPAGQGGGPSYRGPVIQDGEDPFSDARSIAFRFFAPLPPFESVPEITYSSVMSARYRCSSVLDPRHVSCRFEGHITNDWPCEEGHLFYST